MTDALHRWLHERGLGRYAAAFAANDVGLDVLAELSDDDFRELGVSLGDRRRLQRAARELAAGGEPPSEADRQAALAGETGREPAPAGSAELGGEAERRQLTVMFCDLADSTALSTRLEVEDFRDLVIAYQEACSAAVRRFDGYVARLFGDGLLVYFGYPRAQEDAPERAVRAGLAVLDAMHSLNERFERKLGAPLNVRIGLATGPVVVGDIVGEGVAQERAVLGETPNLAARLQSVAEPGTLVIASATQRLLGMAFELQPLGAQVLKGMEHPVLAWRVLRAVLGPSRFDSARVASMSPLVGRDEELALLHARWTSASRGEGQVVVISGEAGIGKSRLLFGLREQLGQGGFTGLRYQCSPYHTDTAFRPIIEQLWHAAGFDASDDESMQLRKLDTLLLGDETNGAALDSTTRASFASLLSLALPRALESEGLSPAQWKESITVALLGQIERLSARQPLLMLFEDVHWMDPSTAELLARAVRAIEATRVLLVATSRPGYAPAWLGEAHVSAVLLRKLGRGDSDALVNFVASEIELDEQVRRSLVAKSDGVPLFLEELTRAVVDAESLHAGQGAAPALPSSLADSLMSRLDALGAAKSTVQVASVIGRVFDIGLLVEVAGVARPQLEQHLAQLEASGLVFRRGTATARTYTIKHALLRDAAYESLLLARRRELHQRIADALAQGVGPGTGGPFELMARHYAYAGCFAEAIDCWRKAAARAVSLSAMHEALAHSTHAMEALEHLPGGEARDSLELDLLAERIPPVGGAKGYGDPEVETLYERAVQLGFESRRDVQFLPLVYAAWMKRFTGGRLDEAQEFAEQYKRLAKASGSSLAMGVSARLAGAVELHRGQLAASEVTHRDALAMMDDASSSEVGFAYVLDSRALLLACSSLTHALRGRVSEAMQEMESAAERADTLGHALTSVSVIAYGLNLAIWLKDNDWHRRYIERCEAWLTRESMPGMTALVQPQAGVAAIRNGLETEGIAQLGAGIAACARLDLANWIPDFQYLLAEAHLASGRTDEASSAVERGVEWIHMGGSRTFASGFHTLRATVMGMREAPVGNVRGEHFRALDVARQQGNRLFQVRAAAAWLRFERDAGGRRAQAEQALRKALDSVENNPEVPVVRDAMELLAA